jgi:hypothetical protein
VLISRIPPGCRTAAWWGAPATEWSLTDQLLAGVFDAVQHLDYVFRFAWRDSKSMPPEPPEPLPRPGLIETPQQRREAFTKRLSALNQ